MTQYLRKVCTLRYIFSGIKMRLLFGIFLACAGYEFDTVWGAKFKMESPYSRHSWDDSNYAYESYYRPKPTYRGHNFDENFNPYFGCKWSVKNEPILLQKVSLFPSRSTHGIANNVFA